MCFRLSTTLEIIETNGWVEVRVDSPSLTGD
jgi:hypothetical protein